MIWGNGNKDKFSLDEHFLLSFSLVNLFKITQLITFSSETIENYRLSSVK